MNTPRVNIATARRWLQLSFWVLWASGRYPSACRTFKSRRRRRIVALTGTALRDALRQGGYAVFLRHPTRVDTKTVTIRCRCWAAAGTPDLKTGVCLNDEGRAEAWLLGRTVQACDSGGKS
jgi:hypothetical protein